MTPALVPTRLSRRPKPNTPRLTSVHSRAKRTICVGIAALPCTLWNLGARDGGAPRGTSPLADLFGMTQEQVIGRRAK